jgi:GNAT superfamily N-acetyltransferase
MPIIRILTRLSRATHGDPIDPIEFHQTGPLGRNRGALPRLRGRGEQGDIVTPAYVLSTLCIGIFDQFGKLVGLIDVLRGYRTRADWYIGLMLLAPGFQGQGFGTEIHIEFVKYARREGARRLLLAVLAVNESARRFWLRLGYRKVKDFPPSQFGKCLHGLTEFE